MVDGSGAGWDVEGGWLRTNSMPWLYVEIYLYFEKKAQISSSENIRFYEWSTFILGSSHKVKNFINYWQSNEYPIVKTKILKNLDTKISIIKYEYNW